MNNYVNCKVKWGNGKCTLGASGLSACENFIYKTKFLNIVLLTMLFHILDIKKVVVVF